MVDHYQMSSILLALRIPGFSSFRNCIRGRDNCRRKLDESTDWAVICAKKKRKKKTSAVALGGEEQVIYCSQIARSGTVVDRESWRATSPRSDGSILSSEPAV